MAIIRTIWARVEAAELVPVGRSLTRPACHTPTVLRGFVVRIVPESEHDSPIAGGLVGKRTLGARPPLFGAKDLQLRSILSIIPSMASMNRHP